MSKKIHVCIITTAHPIDDVRVSHKFAAAFLAAGFRVTWVGPGQAFFSDRNDKESDVTFCLAPPLKSRFDRLVSRFKIRPLALDVKDVDVYYAPEPDSAKLAIALASRTGAKVVLDIHEIYHGALLDRWLLGFRFGLVRELFRRYVAKIASECDLVIGVSDSVLRPYVSQSASALVVRSCAPSWFVTSGPSESAYKRSDEHFRVMHGKSDLLRGTAQVIDAASFAKARIPNLSILMFGASGDISHRLDVLGLNDTIVVSQGIPMRDMPKVLAGCDAGLIAYGRGLGVDSLPNRIFEYMAAGIAIIAPKYAVEMAKIIETERCGMLVDFEDPQDIAQALMYLAANPSICSEMGARAKTAFIQRHNWETEVQPVIESISSWFL